MTIFLRALAILVTTIIGVGIFGLPFVAAKAGFGLILIYVIILGIVAVYSHLMFAKICVKTPGKHRFPGYVRIYLGENASRIAMVSLCIGMFGAQMAYLIVGGQFLTNLLIPYLSPFLGTNPLVYTFIYFIIGALLIYKGVKGISIVEFFIAILFCIILVLFLIKLLPSVNLHNLSLVNTKSIFLPYGIVLFSLWGSSIIPEIKEMVGANKKKILNKIIIFGLVWAAVWYLLFTAAVVGFCGKSTSSDAFSCLSDRLGPGISRMGYLLGTITCFSSFLVLGLTIKKSLIYDYRWSEKVSWAFATILPFLLYLSGFKNYIDIIGLTGAVTIGIEGILMFMVFKKVVKTKSSKKVPLLYYVLPLFLLAGVFLEVFNFFNK